MPHISGYARDACAPVRLSDRDLHREPSSTPRSLHSGLRMSLPWTGAWTRRPMRMVSQVAWKPAGRLVRVDAVPSVHRKRPIAPPSVARSRLRRRLVEILMVRVGKCGAHRPRPTVLGISFDPPRHFQAASAPPRAVHERTAAKVHHPPSIRPQARTAVPGPADRGYKTQPHWRLAVSQSALLLTHGNQTCLTTLTLPKPPPTTIKTTGLVVVSTPRVLLRTDTGKRTKPAARGRGCQHDQRGHDKHRPAQQSLEKSGTPTKRESQGQKACRDPEMIARTHHCGSW